MMTHVAMEKLDERNSELFSMQKKKSFRVGRLVKECHIRIKCKAKLTLPKVGKLNYSAIPAKSRDARYYRG